MLSALYDALLEAGTSDEKARKAAAQEQRFATMERKVDLLTWMVPFNLLLTLGVLWRLLAK